MGQRIAGTFNGTGAAVYICCGFVPDFVKVWSVEDADCAYVEWSSQMRCAEVIDGIVRHTAAGLVSVPKTAGTAIQPYYGGDLMTSSNQTSTTYGEGIYLYRDPVGDYRATDCVATTIDTWTLDTSGNRTGHWNEDATGTYIGEGSRICIDGKWYTVTALTAGQGEAADEVTLSYAAPSGDVTCISGMYSFKPLPLNAVTPAGFKLNLTALVNVNDEMQMFEAGTYDN